MAKSIDHIPNICLNGHVVINFVVKNNLWREIKFVILWLATVYEQNRLMFFFRKLINWQHLIIGCYHYYSYSYIHLAGGFNRFCDRLKQNQKPHQSTRPGWSRNKTQKCKHPAFFITYPVRWMQAKTENYWVGFLNKLICVEVRSKCTYFFILLTHEGLHREVYRVFQPSYDIFHRVFQTTGSVHPSQYCPIVNFPSKQSQ